MTKIGDEFITFLAFRVLNAFMQRPLSESLIRKRKTLKFGVGFYVPARFVINE